jgi:hypothetical protein
MNRVWLQPPTLGTAMQVIAARHLRQTCWPDSPSGWAHRAEPNSNAWSRPVVGHRAGGAAGDCVVTLNGRQCSQRWVFRGDLAMGHVTKGFAIVVVVTTGLLGGSFEIWAEEAAPTISQSDASCNDDAVRKTLLLVVRRRGINNPSLGEAHIRGKYCEIMVSTDAGKEVGYIHYRAVGYKWAPVLRVEPLTGWPAK